MFRGLTSSPNFSDIFGKENLASTFWGGLILVDIFWGIQNTSFFFRHWIFFWAGGGGVNFWSKDFFGFCWKPYGFFWVLIFAPIRSSPSPRDHNRTERDSPSHVFGISQFRKKNIFRTMRTMRKQLPVN